MTIDSILATYGYTIDPSEHVKQTFGGWTAAEQEAVVNGQGALGPFQFLMTQAGTIVNLESGEVLTPQPGRIDIKKARACRAELNQSHFEAWSQ